MAFTKQIGIKDYYNQYLIDCKNYKIEPLTYKKYAELIKDINFEIRNNIIYSSEKVNLPYRLGSLRVIKFEVSYDLNKKYRWKFNYKLYKDTGEKEYFGSEFGYKWKWDKFNAVFKNKKGYYFKACRTATRLIADAINNKHLDFYSK